MFRNSRKLPKTRYGENSSLKIIQRYLTYKKQINLIITQLQNFKTPLKHKMVSPFHFLHPKIFFNES